MHFALALITGVTAEEREHTAEGETPRLHEPQHNAPVGLPQL